MGEGGMREVSWPFLRDLRALCDEKGILLLLDEVQSGMGRTGRLFAHEWAGITPDVMATAKGLGGGFPVGAVLATEEVGSAMTPGSHGSTFGGNPLAMAVGNAVLDVVLAPGFLDHVAAMGLRLKQRLAGLKDEHGGIIEEVRGQGLMLGLKCKVPNQVAAASARRRAHAHGAGRRQCGAASAAAHRRRGRDRRGLRQDRGSLRCARDRRARRSLEPNLKFQP